MIKKIIGSRGSIGDTLNLIAGAFIIVFFLAAFLFVVYLMAQGRVWFGSTESNPYNLEDQIKSQSALFSLMNSPIEFEGKNILVKDALKGINIPDQDDKRLELKKIIGEQISGLAGNDCYIFRAVYGFSALDISKYDSSSGGSKIVPGLFFKSSLRLTSYNKDFDYSGSMIIPSGYYQMLDKSARIFLIKGYESEKLDNQNNKIIIDFYMGECPQ